jgi:hypothetical protein
VQKHVNMRDHDMNLQLRPNFTLGERRLPFECVALVLQGGGALGAYLGGVYEALAEAKIHPDWIAASPSAQSTRPSSPAIRPMHALTPLDAGSLARRLA